MDCTSGIERYVWAGNNILWEMRCPGANAEIADRLEQEYAMGVEYGIVGYTHAGRVDRPLVAYKTNGGNSGAVVVPHMNWRGLFSLGTNASGGASTVPVEWPGFRTTANHSMGETQGITKNWMGSLLEGQRDAGGLMYMRNRYYDPQTGQFTQTDPIGLAGGLNTYGFAAGDPVTYSDPYGLCPYADDANGGRSTDLTDCPTATVEQQQALRVFQAIDAHGGEAGDSAIATTAERRLTMSLRSRDGVSSACGVGAGGCLRGRTIVLGTDRSDGDLVYETVHEVGHSVNGRGIPAEVASTIWGIQVFAGLPQGMRSGLWGGEYQAYSSMSVDAYRARVIAQYCPVYRQRLMWTGRSCN